MHGHLSDMLFLSSSILKDVNHSEMRLNYGISYKNLCRAYTNVSLLSALISWVFNFFLLKLLVSHVVSNPNKPFNEKMNSFIISTT